MVQVSEYNFYISYFIHIFNALYLFCVSGGGGGGGVGVGGGGGGGSWVGGGQILYIRDVIIISTISTSHIFHMGAVAHFP